MLTGHRDLPLKNNIFEDHVFMAVLKFLPMYARKSLSLILMMSLTSAMMPSCSHTHPTIIHLDFEDYIYYPGPTMGEKAAGHFAIDSSIKRCELFFLVNESNPKYYPERYIDGFIDTSRVINTEIAKKYEELRVHFYHRSSHTDAMLELRSHKAFTLCYGDDISEYVWRNGHPSDTLFYDSRGRIIGTEKIQLEDVRKQNK